MIIVDFDERFWECECISDYIHPKTQRYCVSCQTHLDKDCQPDAFAAEVTEYFPNAKREEAASA